MTDEIRHDTHDVENETHRAACAECGAVWADLERISADAARLPLLTPSRDLWSGIEARISAPASAAVVPDRPRRGWLARPAVRMAIAASALVTVTAGVTWRFATSGAFESAVATVAPATGGTAQLASVTSLASLDETVASIDREIAGLQSLVDDRRSLLDPSTIAVLEQSLAVIDLAIAESRRALEADPASRFLAAQYTRAYTSKLTLLRDVATFPTGI
jgi:hypothetical protein